MWTLAFSLSLEKKLKPINVYDNADESLRYHNIDVFFEGAYLLDPYYRAGVEGIESGLYHLPEIAPTGFKTSEYYKRFYEHSMIGDEVGFIIHLEKNCFCTYIIGNPDGFRQPLTALILIV